MIIFKPHCNHQKHVIYYLKYYKILKIKYLYFYSKQTNKQKTIVNFTNHEMLEAIENKNTHYTQVNI